MAAIRHHLSRLGLGTVQFGLAYGINNSRGRVSGAEVLRILSAAAERGVTHLDTAPIYGNSEAVLGEALAKLGTGDSFVVSTKLDIRDNLVPLEATALSRDELASGVEASMRQSCSALGLKHLPLYLIHRESYKSAYGGIGWKMLLQFQESGMIGTLGASVAADPDEGLRYLSDPAVAVIQIPLNLLDSRWDVSGFIPEAARRGVTLVSRSAYLQGLVFMAPEEAEHRVPGAGPVVTRIGALAHEAGLSVGELALRYVFSRPEIASTIVGVDSYDQFVENYALFEKGPLDTDLMAEIRRLQDTVRGTVISPAAWRTI